jgi:uncharacterized protein (DUF488 family)
VGIIEVYTIGVYGSDAQSFFKKLIDNKIDTFCDIRRRRAVRGSEYSFANSKRLQKSLSELKISYLHILNLSPTDDIRKIQYAADKKKNVKLRKRETLSEEFISTYKKEILQKFDFQSFVDQLKALGSRKVVLFCVEQNSHACHRSIVAEFLIKEYGFSVKDL